MPERNTPRPVTVDDPRAPAAKLRRRRAQSWQDRTPLPGQIAIDGTVVGPATTDGPIR